MEVPAFFEYEHKVYLDKLRESGRINMMGAAPYLMQQFPLLDKQQARQVLQYWMEIC